MNSVSADTVLSGLSARMFSPLASLSAASSQQGILTVDLTMLSSNQVVPCYVDGVVTSTEGSEETPTVDSSQFDDARSYESLSKIAVSQFPLISFKDQSHLDPTYLKQIGIVVFKAYTDSSNSNAVNFQLLESFVGSLDRSATSQINNSSIFIDNIVNANSNYINVFSSCSRALLESTKLLHIRNQTSMMLGFYAADCIKTITATGGENSITDSVSKVLEICKDTNQIPLDLVIDAGMSNIAQFYATMQESTSKGRLEYPVGLIEEQSAGIIAGDDDDTDGRHTKFWKIDKGNITSQSKIWRLVIQKFNDFCQYTRKDCMFIADGLRPFCLLGSLKKVRKTAIGSSVEKDIVPYINHIAGINSSYAAGYCNWFSMADDYSGDYFWCPPSIKAASIYIYCDTYFHTWDAPAGMTRGIVPSVFDVAFNPNKNDAGRIYQQCWNYAINYPMDGIIMEGQKTF